jgi:hypothetical protein
MDLAQLGPLAGSSAYLSAAATLLTLVTGILFFMRGEPFGKINDASSVLQMLFMLPIAVAIFLLTRSIAFGLALLSAIVGVTGMLVAAVLQALLVFGFVAYEQTIRAVLWAGGVVGLWLLATNLYALAAEVAPGGLAILGVVAGVGYVLTVVGFRLGGQQHPLFHIGAFLGVLGYSAWAIWLGRLLLLGRLAFSG